MILDSSPVLTQIFVMSKGYCTVLAIRSVECLKKDFQLRHIPLPARWPVEMEQYSIKPIRSRPATSEPGVSYECDSDRKAPEI